jgi:hypothetical protein
MNATDEYERQLEVLEWMDSRFRGEYEGDRRTHIALCCFDLTLEHHAAICVLHSAGLYGAMFALFRVLYESFIRGLYLWLCASEAELDRYEKEQKLSKNFGQLIEAIEEKIDLKDGPFSNLKKTSYGIMNSFTHTGYQHLTRRQINGKTGAINYPDSERAQLLRCTGALVLQTGAYLASMQKHSEALIEEVITKIQEYTTATKAKVDA